jgi:hypothetical protein
VKSLEVDIEVGCSILDIIEDCCFILEKIEGFILVQESIDVADILWVN